MGDHSYDRIFLHFLRMAESARSLNHHIEATADVLLAAANKLVKVNTEEARGVIARMRGHRST